MAWVLSLLLSVVWLLLVLLQAPQVGAQAAEQPLPRGGEAEAAEAEPSALGRGGGPQAATRPRTGQGWASNLPVVADCPKDPSTGYQPTLTTYSGGSLLEVGHDTRGRLEKSGNRLEEGAQYDEQDRLTSRGGVSYQYDANGRLWKKGAAEYHYDVTGALLYVVLPGKTVTYEVDGSGRRIRRHDGETDRRYLYQDALRIAAELDGPSQVLSRFVWGTRANVPEYMERGGQSYRFVTDQVGSVRLVVNAQTGEIAQRIDYDAWGNVLRDELYDTTVRPVPFRFAGGLWDEDTRLVHFGARDYDPETGRWTSRDPLLFGGGDANLYVYAGNDPVNRSDPSGEMAPLAVLGLLYGGAAIVLGFGMSAPSDTGAEGAEADLLGMLLSASAIRGLPLPSRLVGTAARGGIRATGARAGLLGAEDWGAAESAYNSIRATDDVAQIAANTGIRRSWVARAKDHLFVRSHVLDEGVVARFDADPFIANAWRRLHAGSFGPNDLALLRHEIFEARFEGIFRTSYRTAHDAAIRSGRPWEWLP